MVSRSGVAVPARGDWAPISASLRPGGQNRHVKDVLIVCPHARDRHAVDDLGPEERFRVGFVGRDLDEEEAEVDIDALLRGADATPADGVVGTKDRAALLAALVTARRGLPGPSPEAVACCQHKPTSRALQRLAAPEATPRFALLDGGPPPFPPPWFVKPVVGRLSQDARRVDSEEELRSLRSDASYARGWAALAAAAGVDADAGGLVAEELLSGREVTVEGYAYRGRVIVVGITDSAKYPGTNSFERFEYPTALPPERRAELEQVVARVVPAHGFDGGFFNVELAVPDDGPARILEVNARLASQFSILVQALHGRSTYDALFALACGVDPQWRGDEPAGVAVSHVVRVFEDARVARVPPSAPGVEILVRPGLLLSEQGEPNDAASYRLAIVYAAGRTREEAVERARRRAASLPFELLR